MSEDQSKNSKADQIKLEQVRLSFPDLFKPRAATKNAEPRFGCSLLLSKSDDAEQIKALKRLIWNIAKAEFGDKAKTLLEKNTIRICLHEGSEKDYDGYSDEVMFLSATSKRRPTVVDRDRTPLTENDQRPYAGCYVNAVIRCWAQNNEFGKRVNAQLLGIQFVRDGESFGAAPFNAEEEFEALEKPKPENGDRDETSGGYDDDDSIPF